MPTVINKEKELQIMIGIEGIDEAIYSGALTNSYDPAIMKIVDVKSAANGIMDYRVEENAIKILFAFPEGQKNHENVMKIKFSTNDIEDTSVSDIGIRDVEVVTIENQESVIIEIPNSNHLVTINKHGNKN